MKNLIQKYLNSDISKQEEKALYSWIHQDSCNLDFFKKEIQEYALLKSLEEEFIVKKVPKTPKTLIHTLKKQPVRAKLKKYYRYAALIVVLFASAFFVRQLANNLFFDKNVKVFLYGGTEKVIRTVYNSVGEVSRKLEKEISYYLQSEVSKTNEFHEIKVPKGKQYKFILPDSTEVWLNADARIKFPKYFKESEKTRTVELYGEALFNVYHNTKQPFIVKVNGLDIEVLGTKFNVSSYDNQENVQTTLLEGSVKVKDVTNTENTIILKPNEQAKFNRGKKNLSIKKVDPLDYISWIEKRIVFKDTPLKDVLTTIERVYNVEIKGIAHPKPESYIGAFGIDDDLETVFKTLSDSYGFIFQIKNNTVTIKKINV